MPQEPVRVEALANVLEQTVTGATIAIHAWNGTIQRRQPVNSDHNSDRTAVATYATSYKNNWSHWTSRLHTDQYLVYSYHHGWVSFVGLKSKTLWRIATTGYLLLAFPGSGLLAYVVREGSAMARMKSFSMLLRNRSQCNRSLWCNMFHCLRDIPIQLIPQSSHHARKNLGAGTTRWLPKHIWEDSERQTAGYFFSLRISHLRFTFSFSLVRHINVVDVFFFLLQRLDSSR